VGKHETELAGIQSVSCNLAVLGMSVNQWVIKEEAWVLNLFCYIGIGIGIAIGFVAGGVALSLFFLCSLMPS